MKIVDKLKKKAKEREGSLSGDKILDSVNQLLLTSQEKDTKVLNDLGLDHHIQYKKEREQDINRTKHAQKIYDTEVFSGEDIKQLCNKYDLRLLESKHYNGSIPPELTRKIEEFCKKRDLVSKDGSLIINQHSFYILAPTEMFDTVENVPINLDPILFYKVGSEEKGSIPREKAQEYNKFINVHYWGDDFSELRTWNYMFSDYTHTTDEWSNLTRTIIFSSFILLALVLSVWGHEYIKMASLIFISIYTPILLRYNKNHKKKRLNELWNSRIV